MFYTHEASFTKFVNHFFVDQGFWTSSFGAPPPYLVGGLTGLNDGTPALAYFLKS